MSVVISEKELPQELTAENVVEQAYCNELAEAASKLQRGLPALIECDKDLGPFLYLNIRNRLRAANLRCLYLDGRPRQEDQGGAMPMGMVGTMIAQLREAVRGPVERRIVVLPHLDLLTTSQGGLTAEAREVIPLLYENPELVWLGFKDPSFPLPRVIENLFPHRISLLGLRRDRLRHLVTAKESRKFGRDFNPWALYKHVSGVNAVRLRKLLSTLEGEDYPANPANAYRQLRQATLGGTLEVPSISLEHDIGGYATVKKQLRSEILDVMARKDQLTSEEQIRAMEELIPKGMIFWGPPGTGKTLFAKGMASALGAAITIVSGPELKSKWVGESEDNLRQLFHRARQSAPAIIVFDELDSFASARGTYTGSGVEHSMVNQLLTEMDGFHKEEMVFVIGTTNFVEILDPALLRPGRFEFHLHIPYPDSDARREILKIYDKKMGLKMSEEALQYAVKRSNPHYYRTEQGTPFSGDHLNAMCRSVARLRMRDGRADETTPQDVERAMTEYVKRLNLTPKEKVMVATHEAGHFIVALNCPHHPPPMRITIESEMSQAVGYVRFQHSGSELENDTRNQLLDHLCVSLGGIEAERRLLPDISNGAAGGDLSTASAIAHLMIECYGMGDGDTRLRQYCSPRDLKRYTDLSDDHKRLIDQEVSKLIHAAQTRAAKILEENHDALVLLRDEVVKKGTLEVKALKSLFPSIKTDEDEPAAGKDRGNGEAKEKEEKRPRKGSKSE
jgi:cell division protease FtsH